MKKPKNPHPIHTPTKVQAWEWAIAYPAWWLILLISPIVNRWPQRERPYAKDVYRGGI